MGLFDRKKSQRTVDEEEDPSPSSEEPEQAAGAHDGQSQAPTPEPPPAPRRDGPTRRYGVEQVLELMRVLPVDKNQELVAQVVRKTLESAHISIDAIIEDAAKAQVEIRKGIDTLTQSISELKQEIAARQKQVAELERQLTEVNRVKELLSPPAATP
jgi:glutamine synthetase